MASRQSSLFSFFDRKRSGGNCTESTDNTCVTPTPKQTKYADDAVSTSNIVPLSSETCVSVHSAGIPNDISKSIQDGPHQPRKSNFKQTIINNKVRSFNSAWYDKFKFIEYSEQKDAIYCFPCRHFEPISGNAELTFTKLGFSNWKKVGDKLLRHEKSECHKLSLIKWNSFLISEQHGTVTSMISAQNRDEILRNRSAVATAARVALVCARQDIGLRGHRETESDDKKSNFVNMGNFLEIIKLVKLESETAKNNLDNLPRNATYLSKDSQNELLDVSANIILKHIVNETTYNDGIFSLILDEARDSSKLEQMSACIRYVSRNGVEERFAGFIQLDELNARALSDKALEHLSSIGLVPEKCIAQAYDGASVMSGGTNGVQSLFRKAAKNPCVYVHCYAHRVNLVLVDVSKTVDIVGDTFGLLEAIYAFQSVSSLRHNQFIKTQTELYPGKRSLELPLQSDTRWVCKYRGIKYFQSCFASAKSALQYFATSNNKREAAEAKGLLMQFCKFKIIFVLHIFSDLLELTNGLSMMLQQKEVEFGTAVKIVKSIILTLEDKRSDDYFNQIWDKSREFAENVDVEEPKDFNTRKTVVPKKLSDYYTTLATCSSEDRDREVGSLPLKTKYKKAYFQIIDSMKEEFSSRFQQNDFVCNAADACNPKSNSFLDFKYIEAFAEKYEAFFKNRTKLKSEVDLLRNMFHENNMTSASTTQLFFELQKMEIVFPELLTLIKLVLTLPVTSVTAERSFSSMKRIKTYLRSTMKTDRLSNLTLLSIERELSEKLLQDPDEIVKEFSKIGNRRLNL